MNFMRHNLLDHLYCVAFQGAAVASEASGEEGANLVDVAGSQPSDWGIFTSLLDLTCFVITLVTYFVLILGFMP